MYDWRTFSLFPSFGQMVFISHPLPRPPLFLRCVFGDGEWGLDMTGLWVDGRSCVLYVMRALKQLQQ